MSAEAERTDRFVTWDAAYVFGALSSAERHEYEDHLAGCASCQRSVGELAPLPGLLAQLSREEAGVADAAPTQIDEVPERLLPDLLRRSQAYRRRRMLTWVAGIAAGLVLVLGSLGVLVARGIVGTPEPFRAAFLPVVPSSVTAVVDVIPRADGTTLAVECQYADVEPAHAGSYPEYAIWIRDRSGNYSELKTWPAKPNKVMRPKGETDLPVRQIAEVEIRAVDGNQVLLRAPLH